MFDVARGAFDSGITEQPVKERSFWRLSARTMRLGCMNDRKAGGRGGESEAVSPPPVVADCGTHDLASVGEGLRMGRSIQRGMTPLSSVPSCYVRDMHIGIRGSSGLYTFPQVALSLRCYTSPGNAGHDWVWSGGCTPQGRNGRNLMRSVDRDWRGSSITSKR